MKYWVLFVALVLIDVCPLGQAVVAVHSRSRSKVLSFLDGPAPKRKGPVGIIVVADILSQKHYQAQIKSLGCYANRHGYELNVLNGGGRHYKDCKRFRHDFFFKKHCIVAKFLETKPQNYVAAVLDADVVAPAIDRGLDKWADHDADVQFYNRCLFHEITAGNYMVRNTPFAREFLTRWSNYYDEMPPGFSSSDNGAIQLAVMKAVEVEGYDTCHKLYTNLTKEVTTTNDKKYWDFIHCTKQALGPPRDWKMANGSLTLWPRFQFFVSDGVFLDKKFSAEVGPVMHHGIKDGKTVLQEYYTDLDKCISNPKLFESGKKLGLKVIGIAHSYPAFFLEGNSCAQCADNCLGNFSCMPLADGQSPRPAQTGTAGTRAMLAGDSQTHFAFSDPPGGRNHPWGWSNFMHFVGESAK